MSAPNHPALFALQALLPNIVVAGVSFANKLPDPRSISSLERQNIFKVEQATAGNDCVNSLLRGVGIGDRKINNGSGGERVWPEHFVGSLTYKETIVLGALAPTKRFAMLGIDLETIGSGEEELDKGTISSEGLPPGIAPGLGVLYSFSAKEAAFKAQYPLTTRRLNFSHVRLEWHAANSSFAETTAICPAGVILEVQLKIVERWLVSVASKSRTV